MSANAEYAYNYFVQNGWSTHAAAAIVGHLQAESGKDLNPNLSHDDNTGYGIAGWRDHPKNKEDRRRQDLFDFAKSNKADPRKLETQLAFLEHELAGKESAVGDALAQAGDVDEATEIFAGFERPQGWTPKTPRKAHNFSGRLKNARNAFASYAGNVPAASGDGEYPEFPEDAPAIPEEDWMEENGGNQMAELGPMDDQSLEDSADAVPEEDGSWQGNIKEGIKNMAAAEAAKEDMPFDYTPAGDFDAVEYDPDEGAIPVGSYQNVLYAANGGNVEPEFGDFDEYARQMLGGA